MLIYKNAATIPFWKAERYLPRQSVTFTILQYIHWNSQNLSPLHKLRDPKQILNTLFLVTDIELPTSKSDEERERWNQKSCFFTENFVIATGRETGTHHFSDPQWKTPFIPRGQKEGKPSVSGVPWDFLTSREQPPSAQGEQLGGSLKCPLSYTTA